MLVLAGVPVLAGAALPEGYEQLEAVTFDGSAHVDTGVVIDGDQVTCRFRAPYFTDRHVFGQNVGGRHTHFTSYGDKWYWGVNGTEGNSGSIPWTDGLHDVVYAELGTGRLLLDGQVLAADVGAHTTGGKSLLIGSRSSNANFAGQIHSFAVTNRGGAAVLDYVPARRLSDNLVGFYDRVTGTFRAPSNSRVGASAASGLEFLEYAHIPRKAWVDLGRGFTNVEIRATWREDAYAANSHLFGNSGSGGNWTHFTSYNDKWYWGGWNAEANGGAWTAGRHTLVYSRNGTASGDVVLDDVVIGSVPTNSTNGGTLALGSRGRGDMPLSIQTYFEGDVHSFTVTDRTGARLADLVPCRRRDSGEVGFFDRVTDRFIGSQGRPLSGPDAVDGYTFVGAVDFPKGAYVDTGLAVAQAEITADFDMPAFVSDAHVFGSAAGSRNSHFTAYNNKWYWGANGVEGNSGAVAWTPGRHVVVFNRGCAGAVTLDGAQIGTGVAESTTTDKPLRIGFRSNSNATYAGRIHSLAVTNAAGAAVMDLVPCIRHLDHAVGFYDRVRDVFLPGVGTGALTVDPTPGYEVVDAVPFPEKGTFVDTGVIVSNAQVTVDFTQAEYVQDAHVIGQDRWSRLCHFTSYNDKWYWATNGANEATSGDVAWTAGRHRLVLNRREDGAVLLDGQTIGRADYLFTQNSTLLLGARGGDANFVGAYHGVAVTNKNGEAILELVPCVRTADGKYGFFNRVNGSFLTSSTLGTRRTGTGKPPAGYARLNYLRANGAWFDTRLYPDSALRVVLDYRTADTTVDKCLFGVRNYGFYFLCWAGASAGLFCGPVMDGGSGTSGKEFTDVPNARHVLDMSLASATVDGAECWTTKPTDRPGAVSAKPLLLLAINDKDAGKKMEFVSGRRFIGDVYGFQAYDGAEKVRDLVPVRRMSDGCVGLYDLVSGFFFAPQGGNACEAGPVYMPGGVILVR